MSRSSLVTAGHGSRGFLADFARSGPLAVSIGDGGESRGPCATTALRAVAAPLSRAERRAVFCDQPLVPVCRVLEDPFLGRVVAENQTEAVLVAVSPFEVVDERPMEIGLD